MLALETLFSMTSVATIILGQLTLVTGAPVNEGNNSNLGPRAQVPCIAGYIKVSTLYPTTTPAGWIGGDNSVVAAQSSATSFRVDAWDTITKISKQSDATAVWSLKAEVGGFLHTYSADYVRPVFGTTIFPPQTPYPGTTTVAESIVWTVEQATNKVFPTWTNPTGIIYPTWRPTPFVHNNLVYFSGGLDNTNRAHFNGSNTANNIIVAALEFEPIPNATCEE